MWLGEDGFDRAYDDLRTEEVLVEEGQKVSIGPVIKEQVYILVSMLQL